MIVDFSDSPGVTTPCFQHKGLGFDRWSRIAKKKKKKKGPCP